jgi:hypothetical protein
MVGMAAGCCEVYVNSASFTIFGLPVTRLLNYTPSHPDILQICGAASSGNIHATLFHGGADPCLFWMIMRLLE